MAQRADVVDLSGYRDPEAIIQISLLGPLVVERAGEQLDVTGPKRRALLTLLALDPGSPIGRDRIVESLWPERPTGREESTLRVHVSHIRDRIEPDRDGEPIVLLTSGSAYLLASETVRVDIEQFERLRRTGRSLLEDDPQAALANLNRALALWRGRPLQDVEYEEFAQEAIRHLDAARTETIEDRAEALVGLGDDAAAIEDLEGLVRDLPARERPVLLLMRALYRMGETVGCDEGGASAPAPTGRDGAGALSSSSSSRGPGPQS
jgi:DNA-binding SARP family transcriptional activator